MEKLLNKIKKLSKQKNTPKFRELSRIARHIGWKLESREELTLKDLRTLRTNLAVLGCRYYPDSKEDFYILALRDVVVSYEADLGKRREDELRNNRSEN